MSVLNTTRQKAEELDLHYSALKESTKNKDKHISDLSATVADQTERIANLEKEARKIKFEMNETKVKNVKMMRQNEADSLKIGFAYFFRFCYDYTLRHEEQTADTR